MRLLHIHVSDTGIMLNHIQTAMPQQGLKCKNIAARTQIGNRKSVSKTMWMALRYAGFFTQALDELA